MKERTEIYARRLSQMIKHETISENGQTDKTKFLEFHKLLRELFPHIFGVCSFFEHEGSFIMRWPGKQRQTAPFCFVARKATSVPSSRRIVFS